MTTAYWFCAVITAISACISLGFSIAAATKSEEETRTATLYVCARSLPLAMVALVPLFYHSIPWLIAIPSA